MSGSQTIAHETRAIDLAGRLLGIQTTGANNAVISRYGYMYDPAGRRSRATREDGQKWEYGYNARGEVTSGNKHLPNGQKLAGQQFEYAYDGIGNRLAAKSGGDASGNNLRTTNYTPNALNQYSALTTPNSFDVLGRAPSSNSVTVNGQATQRQGEAFRGEVNGDNSASPLWQAVSVSDGATTQAGHHYLAKASVTPSYDPDGNLTDDGRWVYTWDAENRLTSMTTTSTAQTAGAPYQRLVFAYDGMSRRVGKQVFDSPSAQTPVTDLRFAYDGWNLLAEYSASGSVLSPLRTYTWGTDLSGTPQGAGGVGGLLSVSLISHPSPLIPSYDGNGNVSAWINASGQLAAKQDYDPFGNRIVKEGSVDLPIGFSTKYTDQETGLCYYGYRYYAPTLGRWINRDPIEEEGGLNVYGMVSNDSINRIDYLGWADILVEMSRVHYEWDTVSSFVARATDKSIGAPEVQGQTIELKKGNYSLVKDSRYRYGNFNYPIPSGDHQGEWSSSNSTSISSIVNGINSSKMRSYDAQMQAYEKAASNGGKPTLLKRMFGASLPDRPEEVVLYGKPVDELGSHNILIKPGGNFTGTRMHIGMNANWSRGCPIVGRNAKLQNTQITIYEGHIGKIVKLHNFDLDDSYDVANELGRLVACVKNHLKKNPSIKVTIK